MRSSWVKKKARFRAAAGRGGFLAGLAALALLTSAAPASANHSYPATYTGSAAGGGTVEFDVSPDGGSVTRFAVKGLNTTCGAVDSETTGSIPIVNHAFSQSSGSPRFNGTFPTVQQAQGDLTVQSFGYPSCTSDPVGWTASTTALPPTTNPVVPPGGSQTAYSSCVRKANRAFKKARRNARRAKRSATSKQAKRRAQRQLKAAIRKRKKAVKKCAALR